MSNGTDYIFLWECNDEILHEDILIFYLSDYTFIRRSIIFFFNLIVSCQSFQVSHAQWVRSMSHVQIPALIHVVKLLTLTQAAGRNVWKAASVLLAKH